MTLDKIDRDILRVLQHDGRITFSQLAERVNLTTSPCIERVRRLERDGYIDGYTARLSPAHLGASLLVFVQIRLDRTSRDSFRRFSRAVAALPEVQECHLVTGDFDYLIKARVSDIVAYRSFLEEGLLSIPDVKESTSIVAMDTVQETLALPI